MSALRQQVFGAARAYHAAVARYARAVLAGADLERAAQEVVGTSLRYQVALDGYLKCAHADSELLATRSRLERLHRMLEAASRQYDAMRKARRCKAGGFGAEW